MTGVNFPSRETGNIQHPIAPYELLTMDTWASIFQLFTASDIGKFKTVCRDWKVILEHPDYAELIWKRIFTRDLQQLPTPSPINSYCQAYYDRKSFHSNLENGIYLRDCLKICEQHTKNISIVGGKLVAKALPEIIIIDLVSKKILSKFEAGSYEDSCCYYENKIVTADTSKGICTIKIWAIINDSISTLKTLEWESQTKQGCLAMSEEMLCARDLKKIRVWDAKSWNFLYDISLATQPHDARFLSPPPFFIMGDKIAALETVEPKAIQIFQKGSLINRFILFKEEERPKFTACHYSNDKLLLGYSYKYRPLIKVISNTSLETYDWEDPESSNPINLVLQSIVNWQEKFVIGTIRAKRQIVVWDKASNKQLNNIPLKDTFDSITILDQKAIVGFDDHAIKAYALDNGTCFNIIEPCYRGFHRMFLALAEGMLIFTFPKTGQIVIHDMNPSHEALFTELAHLLASSEEDSAEFNRNQIEQYFGKMSLKAQEEFYDALHAIVKPESGLTGVELFKHPSLQLGVLTQAVINCTMKRMSPQAKNTIYGQLYAIANPQEHYWGWGHDAFHGLNGLQVPLQMKVEAIRHYLTSRKGD